MKLNIYFLVDQQHGAQGVNDINTYSSMFAKLTGTKVTNFGETGYIARQSLAYLNNYIIKNRNLI